MWNPEHLLQSAFESNILLFKTFSWFWTELFWMALKKYFCVTVDSTTLYTVMVPRHHRQYVSTNHQALCFRDISISDSYKLNRGVSDRSSEENKYVLLSASSNSLPPAPFGLHSFHIQKWQGFSHQKPSKQTKETPGRPVLPSVNWGWKWPAYILFP